MAADDLAELYHDAAFARRLAAGLVGEVAAEDVWQEALRAVLERPPPAAWNLRGYLRTVTHRLALRHRRSEHRRHGRELAAARAEGLPSSEELVERMEIHRAVVDAVLALDEPYRRTILLLFFEDLAPADIARREAVPVETVHTRRKRALKLLRANLERAFGGQREWLLSLAVLAGRREAAAASRPSAPLVALGLSVALVGAGGAAWIARHGRGADAPALALAPAPAPPDAPGRGAPGESPVFGRSSESSGAPLPSPPAPAPVRSLRGRVTGPDGDAVAGAEVTVRLAGLFSVEEVAHERADADGRYALRLPPWSPQEVRARFLRVEAWARGRQVARTEIQLAEADDALAQDLVLAPGNTLAGRVLDERGEPVVAAVVRARGLTPEGEALALLGTTDASGAYRLGLAADLRLSELEAWRADLGSAWLAPGALPAERDSQLLADDLVLRERAVLRGRMSYPDGTPVRDSGVVAFALEPDEHGSFRELEPSTGDGGLARTNAFTDGEGRFALFGLRDGPFALGSVGSPSRVDPARGLERAEVVWPARSEAHLVQDRARVRLEVADATGLPLEDVAVVFTPLLVAPGGGWWPGARSLRALTRGPSGCAAFACSQSSPAALTVLLPGWAQEVLVTEPGRGWETVRRVELADSPPRGALRLLASDSAPLAGCTVRLATPAARIALQPARTSDRDGFVRDLPAGRFRVEVVVPESAEDAWRPPVVQELEIPAGGALEARIVPERGGRLTVEFRTSDPRTPSPPAPPRSSWVNWQNWASWQNEEAHAFLWSANAPPGAPPRLALEGASPGARWSSAHAIAPGRYRLETRFPGYEPAGTWVDIEPGLTSEVTVLLGVHGGER